MTATHSLGHNLRRLRKRDGLTLAEVSARTGLAISTLSKVENDQMSLTYDKLIQLSEGLSVDVAEFFTSSDSGRIEPGRMSVNKLDDGQFIATSNYDHFYLSADLINKSFVPILVEVKARSLEEFGSLVSHSGEEFAFILEGRVAIHTEGHDPVVLSRGESIYFDSRMGHAYVAVGDGPAWLLSICGASEDQIAAFLPQAGLPTPAKRFRRTS